MRKILTFLIWAYVMFFIELIFYNLFGQWFKPNLLVIFIVFVNLYAGIRYSIASAVIAGVIKDCFSANIFGINIFSFVVCAYMTTFIRRYFYETGSQQSRLIAIFLVTVTNVLCHYVINFMFHSVSFSNMFFHVLIPETVMTMILAAVTFNTLKSIALKMAL